MLKRVAIALGCRGVEIACAILSCDFEGVFRADGTYAQGFNGETKIFRWAGRGGEVKDIVELAGIEIGGEGIADVPLVKREARLVAQVGDVIEVARGGLSTPRTEWPSNRSRSVRCEPRKPAAPAISMRIVEIVTPGHGLR